MFYENELRILQKTLTKCHIPVMQVNPTAPVTEWMDPSVKKLFGIPDRSRTLYDLFPTIKGATVYRLTNLFLCRYMFFELPFCDQPTVLFIGPYLNSSISHQQALEQSEKMGVSARQARDVEFFYGSLPVVRDENFLFATVSSFAEFIWNGEDNYKIEDLNFEVSPLLSVMTDNKAYADTDALDIELMERRYEYENELMDAVAQGNVHKAELMITGFSSVSFESRVPDRLRNAKNYCIISNTLMRKAAQQGGVHPVHLDQVSSDFARRIEAIHAPEEVTEFLSSMLRSYCRLVKRHSMKNVSPLVQKAMVYIENDLTSDLSLSTVAQMNNVSPGYLSGLFKKETGQTFTAYVNSRRIHRAKHLLRTTNLQVQTIAQHCGILDFHYFCRVFKNSVGMTPTEYRNRHI